MIARGEIWLVDLGYTAKVRPVLVLSVPAKDVGRALVTYVTRTTNARYFDAQVVGTTDHSRFIRKLATTNAATIASVEAAVRAWLAL